jgi:hypothetical protein
MWYYFDGRCQGKWVVGEKGIRLLNQRLYFVSAKRLLNVFCEYTTMIKIWLVLTTGTVIGEVIEHLGDFFCDCKKAIKCIL